MSRSITSNTLINLAGQSIPIAFALVAIPQIISGIGTDRFGILTLAWLVIGYFSLFDLGLGRALTQIISDRRTSESSEKLAVTTWTALALMAIMGLVGGLLASGSASYLAVDIFKIPAELQQEARITFLILAAAIPLVVVSAGMVGLLTAYDRFDLINLVRTPLGISNFAAPLVVLPFSHSLIDITLSLVAFRVLAAIIQAVMCLRVMPALASGFRFNATDVSALFRFGGWMTVTNIIGPLMIYFDRFLIGATLSVTAVAYYATPYEMATKLLILPGAISATLFPRFAALHRTDPPATLKLLIRGWESVLILLLPIVLIAIVFAQEGLLIWLGPDFSKNSMIVLQWLSIGILFNALAHLPFALIQGSGRPDLSAKAHFLELLVYLPLLWWALRAGGINGAAQVWAFRTFLDCLLLSGIASSIVPGFSVYLRTTVPRLVLVVLALAAVTLLHDLTAKLAAAFGTLLIFCFLTARLQITPALIAMTRTRSLRGWTNS